MESVTDRKRPRPLPEGCVPGPDGDAYIEDVKAGDVVAAFPSSTDGWGVYRVWKLNGTPILADIATDGAEAVYTTFPRMIVKPINA